MKDMQAAINKLTKENEEPKTDNRKVGKTQDNMDKIVYYSYHPRPIKDRRDTNYRTRRGIAVH
jgi:hypothetical protein